jgi:hypothetical protein
MPAGAPGQEARSRAVSGEGVLTLRFARRPGRGSILADDPSTLLA